MPLSLQQLRSPMTRAEATQWVLDTLIGLGFETSGWQDGTIQKSIVTLIGTCVADFSEVAKQIAEYGTNEFATGTALTDYSRSRYDNTRIAALRTRGPMTLRNTASIPYTIEVGQLIVSTDSGIQFRNVTGGTLPAGSVATPSVTSSIVFESIFAGGQTRVARNAVKRMITSLAGVTVLNDAANPWYTVGGADEESDGNLRLRNSTKWARLTVELVADSYKNIALSSAFHATKVKVDDTNPRGPGTLDVYAAGDLGTLGASDIAGLQALFETHAFDTDATNPPNADSRVYVKHPNITPALDIAVTVYHEPIYSGSSIQQAVRLALEDFLRTTPIGGWDYSPGFPNVVTRGDLIEAIENIEGVRTVIMTTPNTDVLVNPLQLVVEGTWTIATEAITA